MRIQPDAGQPAATLVTGDDEANANCAGRVLPSAALLAATLIIRPESLVAFTCPPPWKSLPPDLTIAVRLTPRLGTSALFPRVRTDASSTVE